jgi:hypothetical protein
LVTYVLFFPFIATVMAQHDHPLGKYIAERVGLKGEEAVDEMADRLQSSGHIFDEGFRLIR